MDGEEKPGCHGKKKSPMCVLSHVPKQRKGDKGGPDKATLSNSPHQISRNKERGGKYIFIVSEEKVVKSGCLSLRKGKQDHFSVW